MKILQNIFKGIISHTFMLEMLYIIYSHKHPFKKRIINLILQMTKQTLSDYILCLSHRPCVWSTLTWKPVCLILKPLIFSLNIIDCGSSSCLQLYNKIILLIFISPDPSMQASQEQRPCLPCSLL